MTVDNSQASEGRKSDATKPRATATTDDEVKEGEQKGKERGEEKEEEKGEETSRSEETPQEEHHSTGAGETEAKEEPQQPSDEKEEPESKEEEEEDGAKNRSGKQPPTGDADSVFVVVEKPKSERASSIATSIAERPNQGHVRPLSRLPLGAANQLSLDDVEPVEVQIRNLKVSVDTSPSIWDPSTYPELFRSVVNKSETKSDDGVKTLIRDVSASFAPGTLTAIIGGSGSGKTTLLNTLAERMSSPRLSFEGRATFRAGFGEGGGGTAAAASSSGLSGSIHSVRHAYVMQQDILLPTLTVRETLRYSADLRLPPSTTPEERLRVVEEVILELGLKECADTRIGDHAHKGCSGGEKRRVSIGVQMLANPSVLFLDEPTTGLDSTSAFQLVRTLKTLAQKGRTIITTIHQPRSEIWELFDGLVLLTKGSPVYSGPMEECLPWFAGMGFELPPFVNPAEFVVDVSAVDNRTPEVEQESTDRVQRLKAAWAEEAETRFLLTPLPGRPSSRQALQRLKAVGGGGGGRGKHASFFRQVSVLTDRTFKVTIRDPMGMAASLVEAVVMGICMGYIFFLLARDQPGIRSRQGALYAAAGLQGYLILLFEAYRLSIDIATFDREHSEGCSDVAPFLLSRRFARLFLEDFPVPFLFSAIFYFMAGFDRTADRFLTFFAVSLLNHYIAVTCAMTCVAAVRHFPGASLIANLAYTLQSMACGFFIQSNTIPVYVRWLKYITYTYYVFGAFCGNEFEGSFYDCPVPGGGPEDPACVSYTGAYVMDQLGFPDNWVWKPIVVMAAFVLFFYTLAGVGLAFFAVEMTIARARPSDTDLSFGKEKMNARSIAEVRAIDLGLEGFSLSLDKRTATGKKLPTKTILQPVTTTFQSGKVNVIMGPSGSGKTSLLNAMALRLRNSPGTRYRRSGKLTFNAAEPSEAVVRSVCSYVSQDDNALLPSLTVRETLRFAAGLRLPSWMSREQKDARAEEVLLKMGLKDCADNLVGSDLIKGISGGEKRRVTIAVQVLTDPRVLLLDEPTSGLDAFTTLSLLELFSGLAGEGRTLILTIHQARSDLFRHFGNVLLLARGGSPVYSGPSTHMLEYFGSLGFECPHHTNPADYALDLITIDLQQAEREAESRRTVQTLVEAWQRQVEQSEQQRSRSFGSLGVTVYHPSNIRLSGMSAIYETEEGAPPVPPLPASVNASDSKTRMSPPATAEAEPAVKDDKAEPKDDEEPVIVVTDEKTAEEAERETSATSSSADEKPRDQIQQQQPRPSLSQSKNSLEAPSLNPAPRRSFNKAMLATPAELGALVRKKASFTTAIPILMHRAMINFRRQPRLLVARLMQVLGLAIILALFMAPLGSDFYSVQNRVGFVQQMASFYFVGMLQNVAVYPAERDVFYAEDEDGLYAVEPFLVVYTLLEVPLEIISCLLFAVLADFAIGFERTAEMYFVLVFVCFAIVSCGESVGIMFNSLFSSHTGFAVNLTSVVLSVANITSGILSIDMPRLFHIFNYISPVRYAVLALAPFTLRDVRFTCEDFQRRPDGACIISTGRDVLDLYELNVNGAVNLGALAASAVVYRLVAWALLRLVRTRWK